MRITRSWRRAIVIPALLIAAFVVTWSLGQAVAATNVPRTSIGSTTPGDRGLPHSDVEFETVDGVTLSGWYVPSTNRAAVVLKHGRLDPLSGARPRRGWLSDEFGWRGAVQEGVERLLYDTTDLLTAVSSPIALRDAVATAAPQPVLLIAGRAVADEGRAGRHIQSGSPDTVELWIVPEAGHTGALATHPEQWEQRVTAFLAEALAIK